MVDQRSTVALTFMLWLLWLEPTFEQVERLSSRIERVALLQLRSSLGLRARDWPLKAEPCSTWPGIQCQNGSVTGINISGFRRTRIGSHKPQFSVDGLTNLTHLNYFNASRFLLPGPIPQLFGQSLASLQVLDLRYCSIRDAIPESLGNLSNLVSLYLSDNSLTGIIPSSLGLLVRLSVLDLSQNLLTGSIPESFASLGNLKILNISSNNLSGSIPAGIGSLMKLQYLNVSNNNLSFPVPAQLGNLTNLVDLDLSFNSLFGSVPAEWRGLRNLRRMLIGNNLLGGTLPVNLFSAQSQAQVVALKHNNFTGAVPVALWSLPGLQFLDISSNNFTGLLPDTSLDANATAAQLNISYNLFYGGLKPILGRFSFIDVSGNYFEGKISDYMSNNASFTSNCLQNMSNQRSLPECASFYAERRLTFDNFGNPNMTQPPAKEPQRKSNRWVIILAGVLGGVGLVLLLALLVALLLFHIRKQGTTNERGVGIGPMPAQSSPPPPEPSLNFASRGDKFTSQQLLQASRDFGDVNLIKHGHSGDLFSGVLESGIPVVIKKVDLPSIKKEAYLVELNFFRNVSHSRFVPLLGYHLESENEKFLVYRYMPNRDLSSSLHKKGSPEDDSLQSLDWITRMKIALGAAEGLSYLHHECTPPIVHRDVQASSILLDDKFEVRLGSLSEVCSLEGDTHQSRITRSSVSEQSTSGSSTAACSYDVYCFGKVLLELVTGKLGISAFSDTQLKEWLEQTLPYISIYHKELVAKIIDPSLIVDEDLLGEVWTMAIVARSCLNPEPSKRPLMSYILKALENPLKVGREENSSSVGLRTMSSRGSWNAALFGSWHQSSSDLTAVPASSGTQLAGSFRGSGTSTSQGSGQNGGGGDHWSSHPRHSKEIFPEESEVQDIEKQDQD